MLQSLENQTIFANPMTLRFSMETITLSYEPGSDFAVALEELIRNSEGVRVERHGQQEDELAAVVKERIRQLEAGEVEVIPNEQVFAEISERYGF